MEQKLPVDRLMDLSGSVAWVTGGGKGIGRAIARRFAEAGAAVAVHYHSSRAEAEAVVAEIRAMGGDADAFGGDLTQRAPVDATLEAILKRWGRLDILINNAGIYPVTPFADLTDEEWDRVMNANLRSVYLCSQAAAQVLIRQGWGGSLVNIASVEGSFPAYGHSHYCTSKAAVVMLTQTTALELGKYQIRVNAVSPGLIGRPGLAEDWPQGVQAWLAAAPLQRMGSPEEVADACLFLASPAAAWITGVDLKVDGGISSRPAF